METVLLEAVPSFHKYRTLFASSGLGTVQMFISYLYCFCDVDAIIVKWSVSSLIEFNKVVLSIGRRTWHELCSQYQLLDEDVHHIFRKIFCFDCLYEDEDASIVVLSQSKANKYLWTTSYVLWENVIAKPMAKCDNIVWLHIWVGMYDTPNIWVLKIVCITKIVAKHRHQQNNFPFPFLTIGNARIVSHNIVTEMWNLSCIVVCLARIERKICNRKSRRRVEN